MEPRSIQDDADGSIAKNSVTLAMSGILFHSEKPRIRPALADREVHLFCTARAMASVGFSVGIAIDANVNVAADEVDADEWALTRRRQWLRLIDCFARRP